MEIKEVIFTLVCSCGFQINRAIRTNEYGYFEIPTAHCSYCFGILTYQLDEIPTIISYKAVKTNEVKDANKR